jgi:hypothetical protein
MTPTAQGRYCATCQHPVTDFTQRTDAEVLALLRQAAGGRVCGRFRAEQLNRELVHAPGAAPRWQAWLLAAATLWGLLPVAAAAQDMRSTHSGGPVPGNSGATSHQIPGGTVGTGSTEGQADKGAKLGEAEAVPEPRRITGRIIDRSTGEAIPGVTVTLVGTEAAVATGADGSFLIDIPPAGGRLQVASIGYRTQSRPIGSAEQVADFALTISEEMLSGLVVTHHPWYSPRGWWYQLKVLPRRLTGQW